MRNKTVAGLLAFIGGAVGLHRFYLGQIGLGILYIFFFWISWLIGIIDAIVLFSMDDDAFNGRFNRDFYDVIPRERERYERRREERYERRQERATPRRQPAPAPKRQEQRRPKENTHRKEGIKKFKDYDYEGAIEDFNKALELEPRDIATHFNLACAHSLMEHKDKSFYHLDRAVALGFDDLERIKTHDALAYLRVQPEFLTFEANGFRLAATVEPARKNPNEAPAAQSNGPAGGNSDLLEQLNRLSELREKGLLTEDEFRVQKEKLLR
jgi:TM2 domain-containing membrane protein YozV